MTLDLATLVLRSGAHTSPAEGVSLMEAVSDLAGEPWSNGPSCTSPVIAAYARSLNDWLPDAERQRLKAYIPRLVGTAEPELEPRRAFVCADAAVRVFAPLALAAAGLVEEAAKLRALAPVDRESAESARWAALAAESAARSAASLSPWSTAESMRSAAESARSAARAVASAARSESAQSAGRLAAESARSAAESAARSAAESAAFELLDRVIAATGMTDGTRSDGTPAGTVLGRPSLQHEAGRRGADQPHPQRLVRKSVRRGGSHSCQPRLVARPWRCYTGH